MTAWKVGEPTISTIPSRADWDSWLSNYIAERLPPLGPSIAKQLRLHADEVLSAFDFPANSSRQEFRMGAPRMQSGGKNRSQWLVDIAGKSYQTPASEAAGGVSVSSPA